MHDDTDLPIVFSIHSNVNKSMCEPYYIKQLAGMCANNMIETLQKQSRFCDSYTETSKIK